MIPKEVADELSQCNKCGLCLATCPMAKELFLEKYTPRGKIQLSKYYSQGELDLTTHYQDIFAKCLLCKACVVTCPSGIDLNEIFIDMREEIAKKKGVHPKMEGVVQSLLGYHNISKEDNSKRVEWKDSMDDFPEHLFKKQRAEVVFFVGCVASFFPMVQRIPRNLVHLLDSAGIDFTILGGEEWCCGFPLIGAGVPEKAQELMRHNQEKIKNLGAKTIVFSCPSCYQTWRKINDTDLEFLHSTEFIERLIKNGALKLREVNTLVTYHDPCDLGRNCGVYDAPRQIIKSIPGLTLVELENNRAKSVCCGGGGNLEMVDSALSETMAQRKIEEIQRTGAKTVVTSCQQCVRTIKSRAKRQKINLNVLDVTELVLKAV